MRIANPIKSFKDAATNLWENPTDVNAHANLAANTMTGGQVGLDDNGIRVGEKKKEAKNDSNRMAPTSFLGRQAGQPTALPFSGTVEEQEKAKAAYNTARIGYGQDLFQTGEDIQRIKDLQRARTEQSGADPVSAAIQAQKQGAMAAAQRNLAASGVKGGVAAGAIDQIARNRDADIAASLYGQQRQSIADEKSLASNMLSGTTSLMYGGQGLGAANSIPNPPQMPGMFNTVICTELHRQGLLPTDIYQKDSEYGKTLPIEVLVGYTTIASPVVNLMKSSKLFTKLISIPAINWAKHISGVQYSYFGRSVQLIGEPICGLLGKIIISVSGVKYAK